jgi:hypothetical protein
MGIPDNTRGARSRKCWKARNLEKAFSPERVRSDAFGAILRNRAKAWERKLSAVYRMPGTASPRKTLKPRATNGKRGSRNPIRAIRGEARL